MRDFSLSTYLRRCCCRRRRTPPGSLAAMFPLRTPRIIYLSLEVVYFFFLMNDLIEYGTHRPEAMPCQKATEEKGEDSKALVM